MSDVTFRVKKTFAVGEDVSVRYYNEIHLDFWQVFIELMFCIVNLPQIINSPQTPYYTISYNFN